MKNFQWYEPFSSFRKFLWYCSFIIAMICIPGVFIEAKGYEGTKRIFCFYVVLNLFSCWISFDKTFKIEDGNE